MFTTFLPAITLLLIVLTASWLISQLQRQRRLHRYQQGLEAVRQLRQLITLFQRHRGLTTALLRAPDEALQRQLNQVLAQLGPLLQQLHQRPLVNALERWQAAREHWLRLSGRHHDLSVSINLAQHNQLIQSLLYLLEDVALSAGLPRLSQGSTLDLGLLWRDLLPAAELIGQARALGSGVAAAGSCGSGERIRLRFLADKLRRIREQPFLSQPASGNDARQLLIELETLIQQHLLSEVPQVSAEEYFQRASLALEKVVVIVDDCLDAYESALRRTV